jgi:AraC-like DNA-binding protein
MLTDSLITNFYLKQPLANDNIQLVGWSGKTWDNISYFPKNYQIGFVKKGKGHFFVGENNYSINEGAFFLIHPGRVHSGKPDKINGWIVDTIAIKKEFIEELFNPEINITFKDFVVEDENLKQIFFKTSDLLYNYEDTIENEEKLYLLISDLITNNATIIQKEEIKENEAVERAILFITVNYKTSFSLDELAEKSFLSKFHLIKVFKKTTSLTPSVYQIQLRLNEARRLIFQKKSLTEVAYELGFVDQAHFTNTFKKYANGANPSDLLKTAILYNFQE